MTHAFGTGSLISHARPQVMNSTDNRPRSVLQCTRPGGGLDARKFVAYQQRQGDETLARLRAAADRFYEAAESPAPEQAQALVNWGTLVRGDRNWPHREACAHGLELVQALRERATR